MLKLQAKGVAIWADEHHWTEQFIVHVRSSEWSTFHLHLCISYQCIWGWQHLQKPSPNVISPIFFAIYISLWGSTHDSADCWSAYRSSAARDSFKCVHDWCKLGWVASAGCPPHPALHQSCTRLKLSRAAEDLWALQQSAESWVGPQSEIKIAKNIGEMTFGGGFL